HRQAPNCTGPQCPTVHWQPAWNDQISSFQVSPRCRITLYQHVDGRTYPPRGYGMEWTSNTSTPWVGHQWNDQASLVTCSCR
ncbi:MAG: hypothetical protein ACRCXM_17265, partial [Beijerinckiaceae bacterium]